MSQAKSVSPVAAAAVVAAAGGKRKRSSSPVFYAVKAGRNPGVYETWEEASQQVQGFPNAQYKKFGTLADAEAMISAASTSTSRSGKTKYYGVAAGRVPGVYTDYAAVQAQVRGYHGSKQKAFATHAEAQAFVKQTHAGSSTPISLRGDLSTVSSSAAEKSIKEKTSKKQKNGMSLPVTAPITEPATYEPGMGPLPPHAEDGFDRTIKLDVQSGAIRFKTKKELSATKPRLTSDVSSPIVVYTDGSSLGNGQKGAVGGVGVYFGPQDPRNVSEPLRGRKQTNQRAELTAVARALDHTPIDRDVLIVTDSYYSIRCLTEWFPKWEKNKWKNSAGKDVENKDLVEPIIARIREREMCKAKTSFKWVKGHGDDAGNLAADNLAVLGSQSSTEALRNEAEFSVTLNMLTKPPNPPKDGSELAQKQGDSVGIVGDVEDVEDAEDNEKEYEALLAELDDEDDQNHMPRSQEETSRGQEKE